MKNLLFVQNKLLATSNNGRNWNVGGSQAFIDDQDWESAMDREHVKGAADKAKGTIKEAAGKLTGDKELQSEGQIDKAKGDVHNAVGNVKDAARNLTK
jgi:uncharacterized protein YjbJ (UPF0337 family)